MKSTQHPCRTHNVGDTGVAAGARNGFRLAIEATQPSNRTECEDISPLIAKAWKSEAKGERTQLQSLWKLPQHHLQICWQATSLCAKVAAERPQIMQGGWFLPGSGRRVSGAYLNRARLLKRCKSYHICLCNYISTYRGRLKGFGKVVWMLQAGSGRSDKQQK